MRAQLEKNSVPLVRAGQIRPFVEEAERNGIPVTRHLEAVHLPADIHVASQGMIARRQLWGFVDRLVRVEGFRDIGLRAAGEDPVSQLGEFSTTLQRAPTLAAALGLLTREFARHSTHVQFRIESASGGVRVVRYDAEYVRDASLFVEQYTLVLLVGVVRLAAPLWRPAQIWVRANRPVPWLVGHDWLALARVHHPSNGTAVYVPDDLLSRPVSAPRCSADTESSSAVARDTLSESLKTALAPLVGRVRLNLDAASEIVGVRPRTLRHRLRAEGTSWQALLDEVQFDWSRGRLVHPEVRVRDVALQLGYADAAHFTRAFRRWAGVTPGAYRASLLPKPDLAAGRPVFAAAASLAGNG